MKSLTVQSLTLKASTSTCQLISLHIFWFVTNVLHKHYPVSCCSQGTQTYTPFNNRTFRLFLGFKGGFLEWLSLEMQWSHISPWSSPVCYRLECLFGSLISIQTSDNRMFRFFTLSVNIWTPFIFMISVDKVIFSGIQVFRPNICRDDVHGRLNS